MAAPQKYTAEQDELLLATSGSDKLRVLADAWGVSYSTLVNRRSTLRGVRVGADHKRPRAEARAQRSARFARPTWFDEDLSAMTRGAV